MSEQNPLTGGCLCGAVIYTALAQPFASDYCHCRMCQRSTGAPVSAWMDFMAGQIDWADRAALQEFQSTPDIRRGFCAHCGSTISYRSLSHPEYITLAVTSLDEPHRVRPTYHIHTDSQVPWLDISDDCARYSQSRT